jgi:ribosomal protein L15E
MIFYKKFEFQMVLKKNPNYFVCNLFEWINNVKYSERKKGETCKARRARTIKKKLDRRTRPLHFFILRGG